MVRYFQMEVVARLFVAAIVLCLSGFLHPSSKDLSIFLHPSSKDMAHQDWQPIVWQKKQPTAKAPQPSSTVVRFAKLENDATYVVPKMTKALGDRIMKARQQRSWTQEQLAQRCHLPLAVLKEYEQGRGTYNRAFLDPLCRVLQITLSKPPENPTSSKPQP